MLKPALVALTVMGCDCDALICVPVETRSAQFASMEDCEAAVVPAIRQGGDAYPLLTAHCSAIPDEATPMLAAIEEETPRTIADGVRSMAVATLAGGATRVGAAGRHLVFRAGDGFVAASGGLARMFADATDIAAGAASWVVSMAAPR